MQLAMPAYGRNTLAAIFTPVLYTLCSIAGGATGSMRCASGSALHMASTIWPALFNYGPAVCFIHPL